MWFALFGCNNKTSKLKFSTPEFYFGLNFHVCKQTAAWSWRVFYSVLLSQVLWFYLYFLLKPSLFSSLFLCSLPLVLPFIIFPLTGFIILTLSRSDSAVRCRLVFLAASLLLLLLTLLLPTQSQCVRALYKLVRSPCSSVMSHFYFHHVICSLFPLPSRVTGSRHQFGGSDRVFFFRDI